MLHEPAAALDADGDTKMGVQEQQVLKPHAPAVCDIDRCSEKGKYRVIHDQACGACCMQNESPAPLRLHWYPGHSPKWRV